MNYINEISECHSLLEEHSTIAVTTEQGTINFANKNFCKLTHFSKEELVGSNLLLKLNTKLPDNLMKELQETFRKNKKWEGDICCITKNNAEYYVCTKIIPFGITQ